MPEELIALIGFVAIGGLVLLFIGSRRSNRNSQPVGIWSGGGEPTWLERSMDWEFKKRRFWAVVRSWLWGFLFGAISATVLIFYYQG
jgi:hypothetical protein